MNRHSEKLLASCFLFLFSALILLLLTGCGDAYALPDVQPTPAEISLGPISGNNYGGHAPLVGSHVFVMQAGTTGYGSKATSLLSAGGITTGFYGNTFTTALDSVSGSPTNGMYYITTDSRGAFYLNGDYTCTIGTPVFLYASGGNPSTTPAVSITGATGTDDTAGNLLITFSTTGNQLLYQGESVTFGVFSPATTAYQGFAGTTQVVSPLNLTTTTFAVELGASSSTIAQASFTSTATQSSAASNPAIVNLAMLGNCIASPIQVTGASESDDINGKLLVTFTNSGNNYLRVGEQVVFGTVPAPYNPFSGTTQTVSSLGLGTYQFSVELGTYTTSTSTNTFSATATPTVGNFVQLNFVYMNEVSTVAAAYALAGFSAVSSSQNDAVHFGTSSTNTLGLQNAALNAGNLYDIKGSVQGTGGDGDTHIAGATTPAGNGTVPQTTINTIANILANCEDSANTYNAVTAPGGTQSTQCATLFNNATSTGATTGTKPNDTATAAINIATHPSGNASNASFVSNLFNAQTGNAPFQPSLATAPNDFTLSLLFTYVSGGGHHGTGDSLGNRWIPDTSNDSITELSPQGAILLTIATGVAGTGWNYSVAIDPSGNIWWSNSTKVYEYTSTGAVVPGSPYTPGGTYNGISTILNDGRGNTILTPGSSTSVYQIHGSGVSATYSTYTESCAATQYSAISSSYAQWFAGGTGTNVCDLTSAGVSTTTVSTGTGSNPYAVAIDSTGNVWVANDTTAGALIRIAPGTYVVTSFTGGGLLSTVAIAIDGLGNIWTLGGARISEFTNAGVAITGSTGYTGAGSSINLDQSGDVWFGDNNEMIGAGAPTVMPISVAVTNGTLGTRP